MEPLPLNDHAHIMYQHRWGVGIDIGQARDPTALIVIEKISGKHCSIHDPFRVGPAPKFRPVYRIRHLERLPLGIPYPRQVEIIRSRLESPPLDNLKPRILVDYTGVGRPVFDMFRDSGIKTCEAINITGGRETIATPNGYSVPKVTLVSRVQALLHNGDLRIPRSLPDAQVLTRELQEFRVKYTDAGNATFNAREGEHDDLVLALAIGIFGLSEPEPVSSESLIPVSRRLFGY